LLSDYCSAVNVDLHVLTSYEILFLFRVCDQHQLANKSATFVVVVVVIVGFFLLRLDGKWLSVQTVHS
jgi:hypothetical protein